MPGRAMYVAGIFSDATDRRSLGETRSKPLKTLSPPPGTSSDRQGRCGCRKRKSDSNLERARGAVNIDDRYRCSKQLQLLVLLAFLLSTSRQSIEGTTGRAAWSLPTASVLFHQARPFL